MFEPTSYIETNMNGGSPENNACVYIPFDLHRNGHGKFIVLIPLCLWLLEIENQYLWQVHNGMEVVLTASCQIGEPHMK